MRNEIDAIEDALQALERDTSLRDADAFVARSDALDLLEFPILATLEAPGADAGRERVAGLLQRAAHLQRRLTLSNDRLFASIRATIRSGTYDPAELLRQFRGYAASAAEGPDADQGYDAFDDLIGGVLPIEPVENVADLPPELVAYQPTPARFVLELIEQAGIGAGDVFYDIGAGYGQAGMLVALLTGAASVGIEIQEGYCTAARRCVEQLRLSRARFVCADARAAPLDEGTVFYMYTPFRGSVLATFLERLRQEAERRPIRVCTYGPDLEAVAAQPWLVRRGLSGATGPLDVFVSRSVDSPAHLPGSG